MLRMPQGAESRQQASCALTIASHFDTRAADVASSSAIFFSYIADTILRMTSSQREPLRRQMLTISPRINH